MLGLELMLRRGLLNLLQSRLNYWLLRGLVAVRLFPAVNLRFSLPAYFLGLNRLGFPLQKWFGTVLYFFLGELFFSNNFFPWRRL